MLVSRYMNIQDLALSVHGGGAMGMSLLGGNEPGIARSGGGGMKSLYIMYEFDYLWLMAV